MHKLLFVEDDKSFGYVLSEYLMLKGFEVLWKETADDGIKAVAHMHFDLAILDVNLRSKSGYDVAKYIQTAQPDLPYIFLTARDLKVDQLKGYQLGAEEYVTKPIDEEILLAKVVAILARKTMVTAPADALEWKTLRLDIKKRELHLPAETIHLSEKECLLMEALLSHPNELVLRKQVLAEIWDSQDEFSRNSMDVYISRLRKYIKGTGTTIRNVHGKGFVLEGK